MSRPNVPLLSIAAGSWRVQLYDPRPAPELLGARFVHGGWIVHVERDGVPLSGRCDGDWLAFDGIGWPETFETGLGFHLAGIGEEFLRPGAGRLRRQDDDVSEMHALCRPLSTLLEWDLEQYSDRVVMRTRDALKRRGRVKLGYSLERTVAIDNDSIISTTSMRLITEGLGQQAIGWYAHPFFPQTRCDGTAFTLGDLTPLPVSAEGARQDADGSWRVARDGGRPVFTGCWGRRPEMGIQLQSGSRLRLSGDWPLDHIVLWASGIGASCEPKFARLLQPDEELIWQLRYC